MWVSRLSWRTNLRSTDRPRPEGHSFIGMQALVFKAELGDQVLVEPGAKTSGAKSSQADTYQRA
jgi:hypothetical protein